MKIKNLFYLLLAIPMVFAACEKSPEPEPQPGPEPGPEPEPGVEYVVDMQMIGAVRLAEIPDLGLTFDENEFMLAFVDATQENALTILIVDEEGNTTLQAGTYTSDDAVQLPVTIFNQKGSEVSFTDANVVVALEGETYSIEATFIDEQEQNYRFTYEGEIVNMSPEKPEPGKEYLYDEVLAYGERIPLAEYGFPDNYYLIGFYDETGNILLGVVIIGADGESILQAGTYTAANGGLMMEGFELYIGETEEYFFEGGDGTIVVGGDVDGYTFDIELTDAEGQNFHFTFEGVISGMNLNGDLPTEDVNLTLEVLEGEYYGTEYSDTYNYYVLLSDLGTNESGYAYADGTYYYMDLYSVEGEVDEEGYIHVPAGTYTFDANDSTAEWTMGNYYSEYAKVNADGTAYEARSHYEAGKAVVTENSIVLEVVIGGVKHTVTYNGEPKLYVGTSGGGSGENTEMEAEYAYANYFGDQYTPGVADNYYLFLSDLGLDADGYEQANGTYYRFDI